MNQSLDKQLQHILQHAYDNAPAVKAILDGANLSPGDIQSIADLDKVPVTSKDRLIELQQADPPFGGFLAVSPDELQRVYLLPGPLYIPWAGETALTDTLYRAITVAGCQAGDVVINTVTHHFNPIGLATDQVLREMGMTVIPAGVGNADLQIKMMLDLGVTIYIGAPSWLMALIEKAENLGLEFREKFCLRKALLSGEPLPPSLRETFVEKWGLGIFNAYAVADLGILACNIEGGFAMRLFESPIVQVVNPETGQSVPPDEVGEVVVTTFNETYPLIRLGTGDLAINVDPAPGQSCQEERSIILVGRIGDAVKVRNLFVHPNQLRLAVGQMPEVARVQAIVTRPENRDELTVRVVLADKSADRDKLTTALNTSIRSVCRVKADRIQFVPADAFGEDAKTLVDERTWE
jgi:phenylacetate-CoA ligase